MLRCLCRLTILTGCQVQCLAGNPDRRIRKYELYERGELSSEEHERGELSSG
jgi:hypothetical protein